MYFMLMDYALRLVLLRTVAYLGSCFETKIHLCDCSTLNECDHNTFGQVWLRRTRPTMWGKQTYGQLHALF